MAWLQLSLNLPAAQAEAATEALEDLGALSVSLQDAAGEIVIETAWRQTPLWSKVRLTALLPEHTDASAVGDYLSQRLGLAQPPACEIGEVRDQDWAQAWKAHYRPLAMGGDLWICPSWCQPPKPNAANVILDPGMAFGTGDHPTTALCLEWLARQNLRGRLVLDYGCGSGILAIAALKLGARAAYAVDNDPQALVVTAENAARNGVADILHVLPPSALPTALCADIVVANILAGALMELAPTLIAQAAPNAGLALSGLLTEQVAEVQSHYAPAFALATSERQGWAALIGFRR